MASTDFEYGKREGYGSRAKIPRGKNPFKNVVREIVDFPPRNIYFGQIALKVTFYQYRGKKTKSKTFTGFSSFGDFENDFDKLKAEAFSSCWRQLSFSANFFVERDLAYVFWYDKKDKQPRVISRRAELGISDEFRPFKRNG